MAKNNIKGILVGVDDRKCNFNPGYEDGGYCWVIRKKDWDNGCNVATDKIFSYYQQIQDFHIYFYVFKGISDNPASNSDEFRNTIFGFADVVNVKKNMYEKYYRHHVKIDRLRLFTLKIKFDDIKYKLEYPDWTDKQIRNFGNSLATQGLLLTESDCELLQSFNFKNFD